MVAEREFYGVDEKAEVGSSLHMRDTLHIALDRIGHSNNNKEGS
jgi:hypothetical protein